MKSKVSKKCSIKLPIIICISVLFIVICYLLFKNSKVEGFFEAIDQYDYIAPPIETVSDVEWTMLYNKILKVNPQTDLTFDTLKAKYTNFITKKEINDYVENGTFQWSDYIINKYRSIIPIETNGVKVDPEEFINNVKKAMPNRYAYNQYLSTPDIKENLMADFYLIYNGEKPVPTKVSF